MRPSWMAPPASAIGLASRPTSGRAMTVRDRCSVRANDDRHETRRDNEPGSRRAGMDNELLTRVDDGLAVITFNRPERLNALSRTMLRDFGVLLAQYAEDPAIGCVMVT